MSCSSLAAGQLSSLSSSPAVPAVQQTRLCQAKKEGKTIFPPARLLKSVSGSGSCIIFRACIHELGKLRHVQCLLTVAQQQGPESSNDERLCNVV